MYINKLIISGIYYVIQNTVIGKAKFNLTKYILTEVEGLG
jgi:hypothetical protein